ncbi:MAG TPA: 2-phosphosulfolactate phosphatase [Tepidisphaeraceae bacterium]|nr:2-phosphosulfolactate phosphatase [Tepidisphaeraceae bacterium]
MFVDVILRPSDLQPHLLDGRTAVVFDVLRATTSMAAAFAAGVTEIRVFPDSSSARSAAQEFEGPRILCGEERCLPPPGFDLGNSPLAFITSRHADHTVFMSTTNGTRAIFAARSAAQLFIGALVNASATARAVADRSLNAILLCAGTDGQIALEDLLGCGAVLDALSKRIPVLDGSDLCILARRLFAACHADLAGALRETRGGRNVIAAGLERDIDFAAALDRLPNIVGRVTGDPPVVRRLVRA